MLSTDNTYLSPYEMSVVADIEFVMAKQRIVGKTVHLFGNLANEYVPLFSQKILIPEAVNPKISKGENYRGLPYVVLDYPRMFSKQDWFAIRCFFWWGNFFSITLQLSGTYQQQYAPLLEKAIAANLFEGWFINNGDDPWHHHFEEDNYKPVEANEQVSFAGRPFIKMAKKIPLTQWDNAFAFFTTNFEMLVNVLTNHAPMR